MTTCSEALETLEAKLMSAPILQVYNSKREAQIQVNASGVSVGVTLVQWDSVSGVYVPVEYILNRLNTTKLNYSAMQHKFATIISGLSFPKK